MSSTRGRIRALLLKLVVKRSVLKQKDVVSGCMTALLQALTQSLRTDVTQHWQRPLLPQRALENVTMGSLERMLVTCTHARTRCAALCRLVLSGSCRNLDLYQGRVEEEGCLGAR